MAKTNQTEQTFERVLFSSRWLMAPMYLGLTIALGMVVVVFFRELIESMPLFLHESSDSAILVVLALIDLTLAGNLLLIVLFSGYENFVSRIDVAEGNDRPSWMGTVDFSGLKLKLIASIVAISAIHLLKRFMELGEEGHPQAAQWELYCLMAIHLSFVVSGVLLALMDLLHARSNAH